MNAALALAFGSALLVQLAYAVLLRRGFGHIARQPRPPASYPPVALSVVAAARNEAERLPPLLAALAAQTHPAFEVVVVDDASTDATPALVRDWSETHPNVRGLSAPPPDGPRKKSALAAGIAAATHDRLVFTDADCRPPSTWLARLAAWHAAYPDSVLVGYGPFRKSTRLLNRLVRYETLKTALFTSAAIGLGRPYMAVGRNLSYPRAAFRQIGGFAHSKASLSGDDDLFVQEVHRRQAAPIRYMLDPYAFVFSEAPRSWRAWVRQKRRHASAGRFYRREVQLHLGAYHLTNVLLWFAPFALGWPGAALLVASLIAHGVVLGEPARRFRETDLWPLFPLLEALYVGYTTLIASLGLLRVPDRW